MYAEHTRETNCYTNIQSEVVLFLELTIEHGMEVWADGSQDDFVCVNHFTCRFQSHVTQLKHKINMKKSILWSIQARNTNDTCVY